MLINTTTTTTYRPQNFNMTQIVLANTLKTSFLQTAKKNTSNEELDYDEFEKETKDGILNIIDKTLRNINELNSKNKEIGDYYQSLQQYLDLKLYEDEMNEINEQNRPKKIEKKSVEILKEKHDDVISEANNINSKSIIPKISGREKKDNGLEEVDLEDFDS